MLAQTVDNLEVIVVDDASGDDTEHVVQAINDPRIEYIKCERHRGAPAARNIGIRRARGAYLAFHDSDDEWLPTKLERQLALIRQCAPFADAVTCGTLRYWRGRSRAGRRAATETLSYEGLLAFGEPPWSGPTILVRRTEATRQVFFDESLPAGQDWDYLTRLAQVTRVVSVREPLVKIGRAAGERISTKLRKLEGRKLLRDKHEHELRRHRHALVAHELGIAKLSIACGKNAEARRRLVKAFVASPFQLHLLALFIGSFLRQSGVIRRIFRRRALAIGRG